MLAAVGLPLAIANFFSTFAVSLLICFITWTKIGRNFGDFLRSVLRIHHRDQEEEDSQLRKRASQNFVLYIRW